MYCRQKTASRQIDECHNMQLCPEEVKIVVLGRKGFLQCTDFPESTQFVHITHSYCGSIRSDVPISDCESKHAASMNL